MSNSVRYSLRAFDQTIEEAYGRFFPRDLDRTHDLLEWRSSANPHGQTKFAVASDGDKIVGMVALIPTALRGPGVDCLGYQAVDTVVDPAYRGRGIFVKLGLLAQDPDALGGDVLWGFPNANAAPGWFGRLGWANFGEVPLLMRPLRSSFLLGRIQPRLRAIDFPLARAPEISRHVYSDPAALSADFDTLWRQVSHAFGIALDRSGDWMRWRLMDKPAANYRCVGVGSGNDLSSFVATKIAHKHGGRLCYVMEAIGKPGDTRELSRLLRSEIALAAGKGAEAALAWCPRTAPNYRAYRKAGFIPVPARLRPIEINFGARALSEEGAAATAEDARWFISFLDSDTN